ncbi:hypothetical protein [Actinomycetospora sp. NBRC 106375]|uniref:hypothetical protein n=1 Tax=Actinomycetospora sp. NBRC 106375 TaxID=3032207 RepID=UPI002552EA8B|nr:hypothetical protein [Actinomycetospora sp. NBRC 106375]
MHGDPRMLDDEHSAVLAEVAGTAEHGIAPPQTEELQLRQVEAEGPPAGARWRRRGPGPRHSS